MPDSNPDVATETAPTRSTPDRSRRRTLTRAGLVVGLFAVAVLLLVGASGTADAKFPIDNFSNVDDTATVTPSGRNVGVTGWVKCTEGEIVEVRVTVVQGSTEATGRTHTRCLGREEVQTWAIHATTRGPDAFDAEGTVRVDAWAATRSRGERTDGPHTWTNEDVTLTRR